MKSGRRKITKKRGRKEGKEGIEENQTVPDRQVAVKAHSCESQTCETLITYNPYSRLKEGFMLFIQQQTAGFAKHYLKNQLNCENKVLGRFQHVVCLMLCRSGLSHSLSEH